MQFFLCSVFNLNNKNIDALIARELAGIYLPTFTNNELEIFNNTLGKASCGIEISRSLLMNSCR